jgi:hypothetical protein
MYVSRKTNSQILYYQGSILLVPEPIAEHVETTEITL